MGCGKSTAAVPNQAPDQAVPDQLTAEEKAVAQFKSVFESIAMDVDKTVDRKELQVAVEKNAQLQTLIAEASLNQLETNKDGRVSWEECELHLKKAPTEMVAVEVTAGEKAEARLKDIFKSIDTNNDNTVDKDVLVTKLGTEEEGFKELLIEAGLNTNFDALEELGADSGKQITWDKFYDKLKETHKAEEKATIDVLAAIEVKADDDGASTAASVANGPKIEDAAQNQFCFCASR